MVTEGVKYSRYFVHSARTKIYRQRVPLLSCRWRSIAASSHLRPSIRNNPHDDLKSSTIDTAHYIGTRNRLGYLRWVLSLVCSRGKS